MDIMLTKGGDMYISPDGDIVLADSVVQKIRIRLLWFAEEWRWNTEEGLPYFDEIFIKNPDTETIEKLIRQKIFEVTEITAVKSVSVEYDAATRKAVIKYEAETDTETLKEEVELDGSIRSD